MKKHYVVLYEKTATGYSSYCPDLPGLASAGDDLDDAKRMMAEALPFHLEGLLLDGAKVPEPTAVSEVIEVDFSLLDLPMLAKTA